MATKPWHLPLRLTTGLYILNSGQSKAGAQGEHAAQLQAMAANAFPQAGEIDPDSSSPLAPALTAGFVAAG